MKKSAAVILTSLLLLSTVFAGERPAREIRIGKKNAAVATAANTEIVNAPDASPVTRFADARFAELIRKISSSRLSFVGAQRDWMM